MTESHPAMQLLTQICGQHILSEYQGNHTFQVWIENPGEHHYLDSIFHSSILRVFALKFTPILNNWRGSEAKGSA